MIKRLSLSLIMLLIVFGAAVKLAASDTPKINGPSLIQKEQFQVLTLSDILALYTSTLGGVSIQEDGFTGNGAILGVYEIELIASDGSEQIIRTIEVQVLKTIGYQVRAVTDRVNIHISKFNKLNPIDILQIHSKTGVFELNQTSQMEILTDNYSAKHDTIGSYLFEYRLMDASGLDKTVSCYITVHDSDRIESPIPDLPPRERSNVFQKVINTITSIIILGAAIFIGIFTFRLVRRKKR